MPISAQAILKRVVTTLNDVASVRWGVPELVAYLNDAQREIVMHRPDASSTVVTLPLAEGARQELPTTALKLMDVVRNTAHPRSTVTQVPMGQLDTVVPGWHGLTGRLTVQHFMADPLEPRVFYVYPPAALGASVEAKVSAAPTDIAEPAPGAIYTDVTGTIALPDAYANTIADYILYRAYSKNTEFAGDAARASGYYQLFTTSLGVEVKGTVAVAPRGRPGNAQPNAS